jgi:LmbE family N-acetylglucosaminyl deacetylase
MTAAQRSSGPGNARAPGLFRRPGVRLAVRRLLHASMRVALAARSQPLAPPAAGGATLVIAPHQDDEVLGCGGLIAGRRLGGCPVHIAYVTDGSGSHRDHPTLTPAALAEWRETEARRAMQILGVGESAGSFLKARDGSLAHLDAATAAELAEKIAAVIEKVRPEEIYLPLRHDGSSEHEASFALVERALALTGLRPRLFEFPVWSWWNPLLLVNPLFRTRRIWRTSFRGYEDIKRRALAAYVSQTEPTPPWSQRVLSKEFVSFFSSSEEFFFER